jgi:alpha-L-fucosidase 2
MKGLCARGGYIIDMTWQDGKVEKLHIFSNHKGNILVYFNGIHQKIEMKAGENFQFQTTVKCEN